MWVYSLSTISAQRRYSKKEETALFLFTLRLKYLEKGKEHWYFKGSLSTFYLLVVQDQKFEDYKWNAPFNASDNNFSIYWLNFFN